MVRLADWLSGSQVGGGGSNTVILSHYACQCPMYHTHCPSVIVRKSTPATASVLSLEASEMTLTRPDTPGTTIPASSSTKTRPLEGSTEHSRTEV